MYFLTVCITAALIMSMVTVERNAAERYIGDFIFVSSVLFNSFQSIFIFHMIAFMSMHDGIINSLSTNRMFNDCLLFVISALLRMPNEYY